MLLSVLPLIVYFPLAFDRQSATPYLAQIAILPPVCVADLYPAVYIGSLPHSL